MPADVRVIVSSDGKDPLSVRLNSGFNEALYFELARLTLAIPPLRDRRGDVPRLVREIASRRGVTSVPEEIVAEAVELASRIEDMAMSALVMEALDAFEGRTPEE